MPPTYEPTSKRLQSLARPLGATTVGFGMIVLAIGEYYLHILYRPLKLE